MNNSERGQGICIPSHAPPVCLKIHHPSNICTPDSECSNCICTPTLNMEMRVTPVYEEGSLALSGEPVCYSMIGCAHCGISRCCLKAASCGPGFPLPNIPTPSSQCFDHLWCDRSRQWHSNEDEGLVNGISQCQLSPDR